MEPLSDEQLHYLFDGLSNGGKPVDFDDAMGIIWNGVRACLTGQLKRAKMTQGMHFTNDGVGTLPGWTELDEDIQRRADR